MRLSRRWPALLASMVLGLVPFVAVVSATPAQAGGWAVTYLDPLPERFEAGRAYTVGYWVLQHGTHPTDGELGRTGLRLEGPDGKTLTFEAVGLREAAHFAVALAVPVEGTWRVFALQGMFAEQEVGTLTVPGSLTIKKPDVPEIVGGHDDGDAASHWGAIHPPGFAGHADGHAAGQGSGQPAGQAAGQGQQTEQQVRNAAATPEPRSPVVIGLVITAAMVVLVGVGLGVRPLRRRLRG